MAKVLCAMSGGVDSSVAAYLLRRSGHDVLGVFLRQGPEAAGFAGAPGVEGAVGARPHRACCSVEDARDAALVAARLDIPFYVMNYEGGFASIIDHFVEEYHRGRTPNPCVLCNQKLKFGSLMGQARALGCDLVATGHYARVEDTGGEGWRLLRARDRDKDQSYFLFLMPRASLARTLFPIGGHVKAEVRSLAREAGLPVAEKPESQEICFVPGGDYRAVLRARTPERLRPGSFLDLSGNVIGSHGGHQHFTIGQRRGTGVALGTPRYVVGIDPGTNTVTLGERAALRRTTAQVRGVQWTSLRNDPPPGSSWRVEVQIRHRQSAQHASLLVTAEAEATVRFDEPQEGVAPGQAAVFYLGDVLLGGGWIESAA